LQQGLPLQAECGAAGQFWTFTMSNSEMQYFHVRRSDELRRRTLSCAHVISAAALHTRGVNSSVVARRHASERRIARANTPGQAETLVVVWCFGPFGPSCLFGGGLAHRRVSPGFSTRSRVASLGMRNRHSRARRRSRPVA